jgi:hypothetical protein
MKFLIAFALMLLPMPGLACVCAGSPTVERAFRDSSAIFSGRLIAAEYRRGIKDQFAEMDNDWRKVNRQYEVLVYRFEVTRWYKGGDPETSEAIIVTERVRFDDGTESVSDCGLSFEKDISYLVYAYANEKKLSTGVCTRTKRMARAQADLTSLERLRKKE